MAKYTNPSTVAGQDYKGLLREAKRPSASSALLRFAEAKTTQDMKKQASLDYLRGQQQIAAGKSLKEVKENQGTFLSAFGETASVQGARALELEQAMDNNYRAAIEAIPDNAAISTEEYMASQQEEFNTYLDSVEDDELRAQLTVSYAKNSSKLAELHTKAHVKYVDSRMRKAYLGGLYSKSENMKLSYDKSEEAYQSASQELVTAMQKPKGMDESTHLGILTEATVSSLEGGNGAMYQNLIQSEKFDMLEPDQRAEIYRAYDKYQGEQRKEMSLQIAGSLFDIGQYSKSPEATMGELVGRLARHKEKYGLSSAKAESILKQFADSRNNAADGQDYENLAKQGNFHLIPDNKQREVLNKLRTDMGETYPEYWASVGVKDNTLVDKWTGGFRVMTLPDGSVDPNFVDNFSEWLQYAEMNEDKAFQHINDKEAKARVRAVLSRYKVSGDLESAIRGRVNVEQVGGKPTPKEAAEINDAADSAMSGGWFDEDLEEANFPYIRDILRRGIREYTATGNLDADDAADLARKDFLATHEKVKGDYIPHGNKPLSKVLALRGEETVDGVLDDFVNEYRTEMFGDHEGDYTVQRSAAGSGLTFVPVDDNGLPVAGGFTMDLQALRAQRQMEQAKQQEREIESAVDGRESSIDNRVRNYRMYHMRTYGTYPSREKALKMMGEQHQRSTKMKADAVEAATKQAPVMQSLVNEPSLVVDAFTQRPTVPERLTQEANTRLARKQMAHQSTANMGWGIASTKAYGESNSNIGKMLDVFAGVESNYGKNRANPVSSARGVFQYLTKGLEGGNNSMQTATTRALRVAGDNPPKWLEKLHRVAMEGTDQERAQAMVKLDDDKSAALMLYEFKARPQTATLLDKVANGDGGALWELYSKYHHTNPDEQTKQLFDKIYEKHWR